MKIGRRKIDLSNLEKVFFPQVGLTKGDLVGYYAAVAAVMIRHTKRYGASMQRLPDGLRGDAFYQKDAPGYFPDWVPTVRFPRRSGGSFRAVIVDSKAGLVYLADQGVVTLHLYLSRTEDLEHPDRMVFDLDPPEGSGDADAVRTAALDVRAVLQELDLRAWVQTTGSRGFHVVVPLDRSTGFDAVREFAADVGRLLVRRKPDDYTLEQRKDRRRGRIFLDMLRNAYGATAVSPYAVRALPGATVATPLDWDEVERGASPGDWDIRSVPRRLGQKQDPWAGLMRHPFSLSRRRARLQTLLAREPPADEEGG